MNSYSGEGGLISFPMLLIEGNAILPMIVICKIFVFKVFGVTEFVRPNDLKLSKTTSKFL